MLADRLPPGGRALSAPERLGLLGAAAAVAAVLWPALTDTTGLTLPCPLRSVTGVPCPLCGMTTAAQALVRGDVAGAVSANPFVLVLATLTLVAVVAMTLRRTGVLRAPAPWSRVTVARATLVAVALAAASEAWQLQRFGWV